MLCYVQQVCDAEARGPESVEAGLEGEHCSGDARKVRRVLAYQLGGPQDPSL